MDYQLSDPSEHIESLESYLKIAPALLPSNEFLQPVLRHPDLQPNNIFVSDDLDIVGLIDWQHAAVLPLFLAAGTQSSSRITMTLNRSIFAPLPVQS